MFGLGEIVPLSPPFYLPLMLFLHEHQFYHISILIRHASQAHSYPICIQRFTLLIIKVLKSRGGGEGRAAQQKGFFFYLHYVIVSLLLFSHDCFWGGF